MPYWSEERQQWGYLYFEPAVEFTWLGINRGGQMPIDKPFAFHKPSEDGLSRITELRNAYSELKRIVESECSPSRERSVALTELETSAMWAIKAVVFNDPNSEVA